MKEAMKLALEAMKTAGKQRGSTAQEYEAIKAIEESLAKQEQGEPVATDADREFWFDVCENLDKAKESQSPTYGMTLRERIAHVGGRENANGYIEFCSAQAMLALIKQVLRDTPQQRKPLTGAEEVLQALDSCEWSLVRISPSSWLTDEANQQMAWGVSRTLPPFCSPDGTRMWNGATAIEAIRKGKAAIEAAHGIKE